MNFTFNDLSFFATTPKRERALMVLGSDDFASYTSGLSAHGLNNGVGWAGSYLYYPNVEAYDDMESYTSGQNVSGLNGGTGFSENYIYQEYV